MFSLSERSHVGFGRKIPEDLDLSNHPDLEKLVNLSEKKGEFLDFLYRYYDPNLPDLEFKGENPGMAHGNPAQIMSLSIRGSNKDFHATNYIYDLSRSGETSRIGVMLPRGMEIIFNRRLSQYVPELLVFQSEIMPTGALVENMKIPMVYFENGNSLESLELVSRLKK